MRSVPRPTLFSVNKPNRDQYQSSRFRDRFASPNREVELPYCGIVDFSTRAQASVVQHVLGQHGSELQGGAVVTAEPGRVRIRPPDSPVRRNSDYAAVIMTIPFFIDNRQPGVTAYVFGGDA
jgi:hypothetical protein